MRTHLPRFGRIGADFLSLEMLAISPRRLSLLGRSKAARGPRRPRHQKDPKGYRWSPAPSPGGLSFQAFAASWRGLSSPSMLRPTAPTRPRPGRPRGRLIRGGRRAATARRADRASRSPVGGVDRLREQQQQVSVCERQWYCAWLCKKCHIETRWCYTFSSMKTSCRVVYESLHGCEQGKEYAWPAGCFGWYTACFTGTTQCFANRLTSTGGCSESICSAPIGMLGDPREGLAEAAPGVTVGESCGARTDSCPGDSDCSTALPTGHAAEGVARAGASAAGM
jgi:hypothetical protein